MTTATPRILCVDDEALNLKLLEALLQPRGYAVIKAENGRQALAKIEEEAVDLMLLDVMMPEMNGYDLCRMIKEDERHRNIPVVMITALKSKEDRVRGIEAGAEEFLSKPFDQAEVLARVKMLLKIKGLNERLAAAYNTINSLTAFGEDMVMTFDPLHFDFIEKIDAIVGRIVRRSAEDPDKPGMAVVGITDNRAGRHWYQYSSDADGLQRKCLPINVPGCLVVSNDSHRLLILNEQEMRSSDLGPVIRAVEAIGTAISNSVSFHSRNLCLYALNYGRGVSEHDAAVLNALVMQTMFMNSLAGQVRETENAFDYTVQSLARASEANDEDTGQHILRVGEYCAILARQLGMAKKFIGIIRQQAMMHDVGKVHIHPDILKKPGKLTTEEFAGMKKHTVLGAKILGDHVRLTLAREIALTHHERWDGSGYPHGLKDNQIPISGRIMNIADQYDALRNKRVYKPAFDHDTTCRIITEGDGRTMPQHFDPQVLQAFRATAAQFETVYERLQG